MDTFILAGVQLVSNAAQYTCLLGCAGTVMFVLSSRQARISQIIRENCEKALGTKKTGDEQRTHNLLKQIEMLMPRFVAIQLAILLLAVSIAALGVYAAYDFCQGSPAFWVAVPFVVLAALVTVWEMSSASDTISHEIAFAKWHARGRKTAAPRFRYFVFVSNLLMPHAEDDFYGELQSGTNVVPLDQTPPRSKLDNRKDKSEDDTNDKDSTEGKEAVGL